MRSLNLGGASAEVENVDAQYSLQGGVTVLVTGHLTVLVWALIVQADEQCSQL